MVMLHTLGGSYEREYIPSWKWNGMEEEVEIQQDGTGAESRTSAEHGILILADWHGRMGSLQLLPARDRDTGTWP